MTCSNPSVVLDEAIVTFSRKSDGRKIATASFGMEWNNDMSPVIEKVTAQAVTDTQEVCVGAIQATGPHIPSPHPSPAHPHPHTLTLTLTRSPSDSEILRDLGLAD